MKNYHEMTDYEINVRVATLLGENPWETQCINFGGTKSSVPVGFGNCMHNVDYCNNPSDAWPIIFDNKIAVAPYILGESSVDYKEFKGKWFAMSLVDESWDDLNPLRAAMIVFLMIKEKENI